MAKLHFNYATMNSGKSAQLLQTNFNYSERGMKCLLLTSALDNRFEVGQITSRLGIAAEAKTFTADDDLLEKYLIQAKDDGVTAILCDEAQFLTLDQVWQLAMAVDRLDLPVLAYGLRTNFRGELFPGSAALIALADEVNELKSICHCGKKATMVLRKGADGKPTLSGEEVLIGASEYIALCRKHWVAAHEGA